MQVHQGNSHLDLPIRGYTKFNLSHTAVSASTFDLGPVLPTTRRLCLLPEADNKEANETIIIHENLLSSPITSHEMNLKMNFYIWASLPCINEDFHYLNAPVGKILITQILPELTNEIRSQGHGYTC